LTVGAAPERTPSLLSRRDAAAIRGLPVALRRKKMVAAAEAIENILGAYDSLGDFILVQEADLTREAAARGTRRRRRARSAA
jgi:hypothetical protein